MAWKNWQVGALAALFALAMLCSVRAEEVKATDEGKGAEFKGKTVEMKDKGEFAIILAFSELAAFLRPPGTRVPSRIATQSDCG